jgi:hypothetical protein
VIISHRHRFIFFAIPKTGTHSVRMALREHMAQDDLEQVGLFVKRRLPFRELDHIPHGHLGVRDIRPVLGEEVFDGYFKFAFVRNPFDRFVSFCAFMSREADYFARAPQAFMKHIIREVRPVDNVLYRPQYELLVDADGHLAIDYLARTETMQTSYEEICRRIGIPARPLEKINASSHLPYWHYYDEELIGLVGDLYRKDLEILDYRFESHASQPA